MVQIHLIPILLAFRYPSRLDRGLEPGRSKVKGSLNMTSDNQDARLNDDAQTDAAQAESSNLRPGIYLEEKKSTIGTGGTAKTTEYRTFWVTLRVGQTSVVMVLLDDDFKPTAISETFSLEAVSGEGWHYIAEGEKRYQRLRPYLERMLAPPPPSKPAPKAKAAGGNWWDGGGESQAPKDPFAIDKKQKRSSPPPKKGSWWEK